LFPLAEHGVSWQINRTLRFKKLKEGPPPDSLADPSCGHLDEVGVPHRKAAKQMIQHGLYLLLKGRSGTIYSNCADGGSTLDRSWVRLRDLFVVQPCLISKRLTQRD
jgi:hypothetical protein